MFIFSVENISSVWHRGGENVLSFPSCDGVRMSNVGRSTEVSPSRASLKPGRTFPPSRRLGEVCACTGRRSSPRLQVFLAMSSGVVGHGGTPSAVPPGEGRSSAGEPACSALFNPGQSRFAARAVFLMFPHTCYIST